MKTCSNHEDCVVVWNEYTRIHSETLCPLCEAIKEKEILKTDKELLERQIEDLEEREAERDGEDHRDSQEN